ncbi:MAG: glycerol-3-phosphate acyltransferase [Anaerolineaceae bacterium]|nr:glycerol-3-phosphate acyltransferase [Anaerolineaceae bacterium]
MIDNSTWIVVAIIGYLLGSIPSAWLIARLHGVNIFEVGSGNMGGTNVARAVSPRAGQIVGLMDMAKSIVAILVARALAPEQPDAATVLATLACMVGHSWSLIASLITGQLRGGKSAGVLFGSLLLVAPLQFVISAALGLLIVRRTRFMSLGVLVGVTLVMAWVLVMVNAGELPEIYNGYAVLGALLIYVRFLGNIRRLLSGTERRVGESA